MTTLFSIPVIAGIVVAVLIIALFCMGYVKAPPDKAYIISGFKKDPKVLIGKAGVKIPFLERKDNLIVKQISVDIKTNGYIPTQDFIGVDIDAVAKIRVKTDEAGIQLAMKNFLNMEEAQIINALTDSLQGNMREIIGTVKLKELCTDRKKFGDEVQEKAQKDMNALGIEIISCNIQRIDDEKGLIVALGQDNMSQIQKDASIAKAQADRDVAIAEADARKAANEAEVLAQTDIAQKQNDLKIKQAQLKKESDIKQAEADAAYSIQEETQRKTIEVAKTEADIAKQDKEIELQKKVAEVKEQELAATIKKQAEADKYAAQQKADAILYQRQKDAEAKQFEIQKDAEAKKSQAEADRYSKEQEAEGIRAVGEAEAKAIQAKGIAEAEAMEKKAEAYSKYNKAAVAEMMIKVLPEIAGKIAEPLAKIDKITIIGGDGGTNGVDQIAGNVPAVMAKLFESMKETTGIDLADIVKADTYDAKVNRNVNITGLSNSTTTKETYWENKTIDDAKVVDEKEISEEVPEKEDTSEDKQP